MLSYCFKCSHSRDTHLGVELQVLCKTSYDLRISNHTFGRPWSSIALKDRQHIGRIRHEPYREHTILFCDQTVLSREGKFIRLTAAFWHRSWARSKPPGASRRTSIRDSTSSTKQFHAFHNGVSWDFPASKPNCWILPIYLSITQRTER